MLPSERIAHHARQIRVKLGANEINWQIGLDAIVAYLDEQAVADGRRAHAQEEQGFNAAERQER